MSNRYKNHMGVVNDQEGNIKCISELWTAGMALVLSQVVLGAKNQWNIATVMAPGDLNMCARR